jgi:hypothetical protein
MSTPDSTPETSNLDADGHGDQDRQTQSPPTRLAASSSNGKVPLWKRLLGRG